MLLSHRWGPTAAAEIEGGLDEGWGDQTLGPADFHRALLPGGSLGVDVSGGLLFVESRPHHSCTSSQS